MKQREHISLVLFPVLKSKKREEGYIWGSHFFGRPKAMAIVAFFGLGFLSVENFVGKCAMQIVFLLRRRKDIDDGTWTWDDPDQVRWTIQRIKDILASFEPLSFWLVLYLPLGIKRLEVTLLFVCDLLKIIWKLCVLTE